MSDSEKADKSPQKEEPKPDVKPEKMTEGNKEKVSQSEESQPEKMETDVKEKVDEHSDDDEEEDEKEEKSDVKDESMEETPKKTRKPTKKKKFYDENEELPLGLLERPVVLEAGKREKRKVERLAMTMNFNPHEKKKVDIHEGKGKKLGECPIIEFKISHSKAEELKPLHRLLYSRVGSNMEVKRNVRQFSGFTFSKEDKEYEKRMLVLSKFTVSGLKLVLDVLDLDKKGQKQELVTRIMEFLLCPEDSGRKIPAPKKRGRSKVRSDKGKKRKRSEDKEKKKKKSKDSEGSADDEDDHDDEDDDDVENDKEDDSDKVSDEEEEESEEEAPKKKKPKLDKPTPKKTDDKKRENNKKEHDKKEKKEKPKKEKKETKKKRVVDSDEDSVDSDDEPLETKKTGPPSNDELKEVVKKILDGANLEEVTMKTVVKQVYSKYPAFDLTDKKEFIKNTVKQLIS